MTQKTEFKIDASKSAILVMDFQNAIVNNYSGTDRDSLLGRVSRVLQNCRDTNLPRIYVKIDFRPGFPEVSPKNLMFKALKVSDRFIPGSPGMEIHGAVSPQNGDVVVTKRRVSAFAGSDLEVLLRAQGIDTLVLTGIATSGVVLSTLRYAADLDFQCIVLKDCCADMDPEVHRVLTEKVFPRQATVLTAEEFLIRSQ